MAALDIPTVMLTHLIPPPNTEDAKSACADDVRRGGYTGELHVCDDLDTVVLTSIEVARAGPGA